MDVMSSAQEVSDTSSVSGFHVVYDNYEHLLPGFGSILVIENSLQLC